MRFLGRSLTVASFGLVVGLLALGTGASASAGTAPVKIVLVSAGGTNDGSWTQSWYDGTLQAEKALGNKVKVTFVSPPDTTADYDHAAAAALGQGANVFVFATAEVPQLATKYASQFPKAWVGDIEPPRTSYPKNLFTALPNFQDGTFSAGVLAAEVSKTKHIGVIGAFQAPILTSELEGFILGARYVDPSIKISRTYINSFTDPSAALAAGKAEIAAGADVLFSGTDQATQGIYKAAEGTPGTLVITQYFDTYSQAPSVILTSVLYNLQAVAEKIITLAANHQLTNKAYAFTLQNLGVGKLAPFHGNAKDVSATASAELMKIEGEIASGKICIPGPGVLGTNGSGSKVNPQTAVKC